MTKQGNVTQRTSQAKKQSDHASRQVSKQTSGSTNTPYDLVFPAMGPSLGTTQPTATITSTTPTQTAPGTNTTEPPPPPIRNKGPELGADNLALEGVANELAPSDFVSQNYETLVALMQEETKKRSSQSLQARLNFGPEDEVSPPRHRKERRGKDNRRPPPCPEKTKAVIQLPSPRTLKEVQSLNGKLAGVNRQIPADFLIEKPGTDAVLPRAKYNSKNHGSYSRMDRHAWTSRAQASSSL
ncbi:hypothetical protein Tco_0094601, partial [Tanacetum coccineum]